ncbi:maleylpyruvate isomerase family mycothiol-dependent enzyme [Kribbella sp. NPDC056951]|uniref:maleylpyruvate isomerase family mycothiol-dependent enzyme n=1 Tax=Kribbella sp. NPDC056951 TaxID=3345978 RepID=UPI00363A7056
MGLPAEFYLSAEYYLEQLAAESARLREVAELGLDAAVPSCPGWTVESVVRHVAQVYLHKIEVLRLGALPKPWPPEGLDERDAFELYDESLSALTAALRQAGTTQQTWTFSPADSTSGFWYRRMAMETVVHRIDAELAHDVVTPIAAELALDGIDELLYPNLGGPWWDENWTKHPLDATVRITAEGRSWTVRADATSVTVLQGAEGEADAEIFGDPGAVYLWLWGRTSDDAVQFTGSEDVVREFRGRLTEATQ